MSAFVLRETRGPVGVITLNRPERHNSLVPALLYELLDALEALRAGASVRVVVLQAAGRSFSTGGDVQGFYEHRDDLSAYALRIVGALNQVILAMVDLPLPIVAAVHGIVTGGSLGLVLGADLVLVAPAASFTPYYTLVGFSPDGGWTAMLPSIIGGKRAAEILMANRTITAQQAVAWGLASRVVPGNEIRAEALKVAGEIAALKPGSMGHTKRLLHRSRDELVQRLEAERQRFVEQIVTTEARDGIQAFLARR
jgi:enoyl-CoA hydratase/carnithine racemase